MKFHAAWLAAFAAALPCTVWAHTIPDDVAIQIWAKPDGQHLHLLVRLPIGAMADTPLPSNGQSSLNLREVEAILPDASKTWISDWMDLYENGTLLAKPRVVETRLSIGSDNSFANYDDAWAHVTGPRLPSSMEIAPAQALVDVLFDYSIQSDRSAFAIHSKLARLGGRVVTLLKFVPARSSSPSALQSYGFVGDPGLFSLEPRWTETIQRFLPMGFFGILRGAEYLLFLFCVALALRRISLLIPFMAAFAVTHSLTLMASAYNLVPDGLWFPVLFETLIALSILYVALDVIAVGVTREPVASGWPLAGLFGLIFGFGFAFALRPALQFGGSHALTAVLSFNAGIELGQLLALAVFVSALRLLFRFGVLERIGTIFVAALAAHTAWHRMLERAQWLSVAQIPWPAWTASWTGWTAAALLTVGAVYLVARRYSTRAWRITASDFSRIR